MVNELMVYCPNADAGCDVTMERSLADSHLENECKYTTTQCNISECQTMLLKKDLTKHAQECPYRLIECDACHAKVKHIDLKEHRNQKCPATIIECTSCHQKLSRAEYTSHTKDCSEYPIACVHEKYGCEWTGPKRISNQHISNCSYEKIKGFLEMTENRIFSLEAENEALRINMNDIAKKLDSLYEQEYNLGESSSEKQMGNQLSQRHQGQSNASILQMQIDQIQQSILQIEMQQNNHVHYVSENLRLQEELQTLRSMIHGIRIQLHWLIMERRNSIPLGATRTPNLLNSANMNINTSNRPPPEVSTVPSIPRRVDPPLRGQEINKL